MLFIQSFSVQHLSCISLFRPFPLIKSPEIQIPAMSDDCVMSGVMWANEIDDMATGVHNQNTRSNAAVLVMGLYANAGPAVH